MKYTFDPVKNIVKKKELILQTISHDSFFYLSFYDCVKDCITLHKIMIYDVCLEKNKINSRAQIISDCAIMEEIEIYDYTTEEEIKEFLNMDEGLMLLYKKTIMELLNTDISKELNIRKRDIKKISEEMERIMEYFKDGTKQ